MISAKVLQAQARGGCYALLCVQYLFYSQKLVNGNKRYPGKQQISTDLTFGLFLARSGVKEMLLPQ